MKGINKMNRNKPKVLPPSSSLEPPMPKSAKWHMNHKPYQSKSRNGDAQNGKCGDDKKRTGNI